jgi:pimeloyl-ACP methyl ester carboxylesterase
MKWRNFMKIEAAKLAVGIAIMLGVNFCLFNIAFANSNYLQKNRVKNIVLVHGAFSDGSSWNKVIGLLQSKGYHVTAVQIPLTSLTDDIKSVQAVLARQSGDVILVGHSWGGVVITQAGNDSKVKALVYISALVPDSNESVVDLFERIKAPAMKGLQPDQDGLIWLDTPEKYKMIMANDLSMDTAELLVSTQKPIAADAFTNKVQNAVWHSKPAWYLKTTKDRALDPEIQEAIAKHISANMMTIASSHMSLLSHPENVADIIEKASIIK